MRRHALPCFAVYPMRMSATPAVRDVALLGKDGGIYELLDRYRDILSFLTLVDLGD